MCIITIQGVAEKYTDNHCFSAEPADSRDYLFGKLDLFDEDVTGKPKGVRCIQLSPA